MPFNPTERSELLKIPNLFGSEEVTLDDDEYEFFERIGNMRQLRNYLIINPPKSDRIVETAVLILLVDDDFEMSKVLNALDEFLNPPYRLLIDFSFLLEKADAIDEESRFRYSWAQMSTSLPLDISLIKDDISFEKLINELPSMSETPDIVARSHANQSHYNESGYQLRKLLTCNIYITKFE